MHHLTPFTIGLVLLTASVSAQTRAATPTPTTSFVIVAGSQFGPIRDSTMRADLAKMFGGAVKDGDVSLGEGFCTPGTLVYPGTPDEVEIAWQDAAKSQVAFVRTMKPGGRWVTSRGVKIGTTLRELEKLAGTVLTFSGFDWDYGGGLEWKEATGAILLRISPVPNQPARRGPQELEIVGDKLVRSNHPLIRKLRIVVEEMTQTWGTHFGEKECL